MNNFKRLLESKVSFYNMCDRLRIGNPKGEKFWQHMMDTKKEISEKDFLRKVDISDILDEDETWKDWMLNNRSGETKFYKSDGNVYFVQSAGFEWIFK